MSTNYLALRSSAAPTLTVSTLLGSTIAARSISLQSTTISLGQSTNQTYRNFSNGSFTTGWASTLTGPTSIKKVVLSPNGSVQTILQNSGSTMSTVITSANSGITWAGSTMRGLPTSGALPYQTYGSTINTMTVPSITAITAAPSGTNQLAIASNELVYASANSGATFAATGLGQNNSPFIYLPFDGSVTDVIGNSVVTATGSMAYVAGKVGTNALNLVNTAGIFSNTANNYVRCTIPSGMTSFTISGWFNSQTTVTTGYPTILTMYSLGFLLYLNPGTTIQLVLNYPTGSGNGQANIQTSCGIAMNTWYSFTIVYQIGTISLYLNGALVGTGSSTGLGTFTGSTLGLGCYDSNTNQPFSGYIDDFRLYNYAVTNPSGAALINPIVGPIMPFVYLTFDGSTTTDVMGNSTVTATGSPGYVVGQVGSNAIYFANAGTGSNPTQYLTGTVSGLGNAITFSCWFQALILPSSGAEVVWGMNAVTSGNIIVQFAIATTGIVSFQYFNGSSWQVVYSASAISLNTWYHAVCIYQGAGTFSLYLNGALTTNTGSGSITPAIASYTIGGANASPVTPTFGFRGYVDDFRIYTGAFTPSQLSPVLYSPSHAIGSPNIYLPFENGSVLDVMGYSAVSARGTMNFVPGVVGSTALNLVNPAGGTAVNYVRGSWAGSANFTVSFWFNAQTLGVSQQVLFSAYAGNYVIYLNSSNRIVIYLPSGGAGLNALTGPVISINTWYYVTATFQTNGSCALYVNNSLIGSYTNSGGVGSYISTAFSTGTYDTTAIIESFNGYIDDFKIYNCAVPFHALGPMNYTQAAISNSGAYQVVAAANGGVYTSANSGSTWSQATLASLQPAAAVNTVGGQVITPNLAGLAAETWTQNGVNWAVSASSALNTYNPFKMFNNTSADSWANSVANYTSSTNTSGQTTIILGVGTATGDWLQIQSSVPFVMTSYQFASGGTTGQLAKTYYIVGSNDGTTWYPIQFGSGSFPGTAAYTVVPGTIIVNSTSTQTFGSSTIATISYSTTTNAYTYFRLISLTNYNASASHLEIGEWFINFATPPTPLYVAPSTALIANQSLNAITVMPQQTGITSNTWTINGISWVASASSSLGALYPYGAFNNYVGSAGTYSWGSNLGYSGSSPFACTSGVSTTIQGIGATVGEWLQIQTSVPLVMQTYSYTCGGFLNIPKKYWIVGSNDGSTWYPIQYADMTINPFTANFQVASTYITVNQSGIQTIIGAQTGSGSFITYPTTTNAYTYFRILATNVFGGGTLFELGEWFINFTAYTPALLQSLSMSPTGQYIALTGAGAVAPNLTGLAANTWTANGVNWTAAASTNPNSGWKVFNNTYAYDSNWFGSFPPGQYSATGTYTGTITTTIIGTMSGFGSSIPGEWVQLQSSVPLILSTYSYAIGNLGSEPKTMSIVGSNDGTNWYPLQFYALTVNPFTNSFTTMSTNITMNITGNQTVIAGTSQTATTTSYPTTTQSFLYFRFIINTNFLTSINTCQFGELFLNFQSGPTFYSTDYGSSWTRSLTAATVPNANVLATSGNGQYSLQGYGQTVTLVSNTVAVYSTGIYTTPTFSPALTFPVSNAAISATGQYMVVLTQGSSNNVYYSSNYGVSFTGITLGSTAMVSCAVSADGSYITVSSATQVFTLNSNAQGFSVTIGSQAGLINQGQNAVAIGNQAGQTNQSANSIVLNSSGTAVNAYVPGFFVAPVLPSGSSVSSSFAVLGYGSDNQVVQTGMTMLSNGTVGIGATNPGTGFSSAIPNAKLTILNGVAGRENGKSRISIGGDNSHYAAIEAEHIGSGATTLSFMTSTSAFTNSGNPETRMFITNNGNVGIGTTSPFSKLHIIGDLNAPALTINNNETWWSNSFSILLRNNQPNPSFFYFLQKAAGSGSYHPLTQGGDHLFLSMDQQNGVTGANGIVIGGWAQTAGLRIGTTSSNFSGNVGIGTSTPAANLHVFGSTTFLDGASSTATAGDFRLVVSKKRAVDVGSIIFSQGGNGVASGFAEIGLIENNNLSFGVNSTAGGYSTNRQMIIYTTEVNTTHLAGLSDNGSDLGWAGKRWRVVWAVNGTIQTSDSNVKDAIPLSYGINEIIQMRTIKYKWKSQADLPDDDPSKNFEYYGFCADELAPLFPELVYNEDTSAPVQMNYSELLPVVVNALKEEHASAVVLKATVDSQAEQITALQAENTQLKSQMSSLQAANAATSSQMAALLAWAQTQGFS